MFDLAKTEAQQKLFEEELLATAEGRRPRLRRHKPTRRHLVAQLLAFGICVALVTTVTILAILGANSPPTPPGP